MGTMSDAGVPSPSIRSTEEHSMAQSTCFSCDDERWQALVRRDRRADGAFLYAVKTTGVYCRPTCCSRTPNRKNVLFFGSCEQAERRGFRACKKCRPDVTAVAEVPPAVQTACELMDRAETPPTLEELARAVDLSPSYFHRLFKRTTGITPRAYAVTRRSERFRAELRRRSTVSEAMYEAGYSSSSRCYEETGRVLGMTPAQYRQGGAGQTIRVAVVSCSLGALAIAATQRGICSIQFDNDPQSLRDDLAVQFPRARILDADPELSQWVEQIVRFVDSPRDRLDLPLDIQGTAFQRLVWQQLQAIPAGMTVSYTELAERVGKPHAVRAVASACAANQIAIAIPCHRAVRKDGQLSGYRWGVERKRELIDREAAAASDREPSDASSAPRV